MKKKERGLFQMFKTLIKLSCAFLVILLNCVFLSACQGSDSSLSPGDHSYPNTTSSPLPTANAPAVQTWQDAYAEFLRGNIPTSEIDIDALPEGSEEQARLSAFMAGGYLIAPFFYIYDIDKNETPELVFIDPTYSYDAVVYTFKDNSIVKLGNIEFYPFGGLGIPLGKQKGLYSDVGYKGHYGEVLYYTIENGTIVSQLALVYNNQPDVSPEKAGTLYDFNNFDLLDFYEVTEANILEIILSGKQETP